MRARFQSDMSVDSEKICDRFTDIPASGPILQPKRTSPFAKWRTLKVNLLGKKGRLMKRRSTFLYHNGRNIPAFLTKLIPTTRPKQTLRFASQFLGADKSARQIAACKQALTVLTLRSRNSRWHETLSPLQFLYSPLSLPPNNAKAVLLL